MRLMNQQSQELDATPLVSEIEKDGAPPTLG
jgi:hypothetical protein